MTSADNTSRALLAERFGEDLEPLNLAEDEVPQDARRLAFVATLHLMIQWVMDHPNLPVPYSSGLSISVPDLAALQRAAQELGVAPYPDDQPRQITIFRPFDGDEFYTPITVSIDSEGDGR